MKIIGITGPTGAGKGALCSMLIASGIPCINADEVYHQLLTPPSPCLDALVEHFGADILTDSGCLDRRALASKVFAPNAEEERENLNRITHAFVREKMLAMIDELELSGCSSVCLDVPLLFESGFDGMCDLTVAVLAEREKRIERIVSRDRLDRDGAIARAASQPGDEFYTYRADLTVYNNSDLSDLKEGFEQIVDRLEKLT